MRRQSSSTALACAVLLAVSAVASAGPVVGLPRKPADPNAKTIPLTTAIAAQPDLSSFAAILKFIGADDELAAGTDADLVTFAPTNAALDAFAKTITGNAKATAKDLLQDKYLPLLAHIASSHIGEDDDDNGVFVTLGGQSLLVTDEDGRAGKAPARATVISSRTGKKTSAAILREQDLGETGDLFVVDRVLKPDDVYATTADAIKADPELATYGRLVDALAPELAKSVNAGAPATIFAPTNAALDKYLKKAGLTEAKVVGGSADLKRKTTGTLAYHVAPGVGLDTEALADSAWTLKTALVYGDQPLSKDDVVKTLKAGKAKDGKTVVVQGDLSKAQVKGQQVYAGADVIHKVDTVLEPAAAAGAKVAAAAATKTAKPSSSSPSGRKLLRSAQARNRMIRNTQRANIRRAMNGSISVAQATAMNNRVAALAPMGRVPSYFLTRSGQGIWM